MYFVLTHAIKTGKKPPVNRRLTDRTTEQLTGK
jgi:hypothetical protein